MGQNSRSRAGVWVGSVVCLVALLVVIQWGVEVGWETNEWGVLGTWIASLGTIAAVIVALRQSWQAKKDAEAAEEEAGNRRRLDAEAADARLVRELEEVQRRAREDRDAAQGRLENELARSEELLDRQLASQRRSEQIATFPAIWVAVARLTGEEWREFVSLQKYVGWRNRPVPEIGAYGMATLLKEKAEPWPRLLVELELSFDPALYTVSEPALEEFIRQFYADYRQLLTMAEEYAKGVFRGKEDVSIEPIRARMKHLRGQRRVLVNLVREVMHGLPPIEAAPQPSSLGTETTA